MTISDTICRRLVDIECHDFELMLKFEDGGIATIPYWWYPRLANATAAERSNWEITGRGRGIHWPEIDEDLSINGMLAGLKAPGAKSPAEAAE